MSTNTLIRTIVADYSVAVLMENHISITNKDKNAREIMCRYEKCKDVAVTLDAENRRLRDEITALQATVASMNFAAERAAFADTERKTCRIPIHTQESSQYRRHRKI